MEDKKSQLWQMTHSLSEKWAETAEENIHEKVDEILNGRIKEMVLHICGFEHHWQYKIWKIDHCNNRSGNSPAGQIIAEAVHDRLHSLIGNLELAPNEISEIKNEARDHYIKIFKREMKVKSERLAKEHAESFVKKEVGSALEGAAESVRLRLMEAK